jgi:GT2 family glycosyltransferase
MNDDTDDTDEWWATTSAMLFSPQDRAELISASSGGNTADFNDPAVDGAQQIDGQGQFDVREGIDDQSAGPLDERATEWFAAPGEDDWQPADSLPRRHHHVTAVLVAHDGATWLPAVLTTLAGQVRPPDAVVGVDTGSTDNSLTLLRASLGVDRVVQAPRTDGFGQAATAGLQHVGRVVVAASDEPAGELVQWVWLLHDDGAPDSSCLEALLNTADDNPSAAVLGPKILGWHDRRLLLEVGVSITGAGRRFTGLERREHDQGQHDGVRDVLAVSSAGMLVRREVWDRLGGFDVELPLFRDDLDFCWRAHRAGVRVIVATDAVLHHREASAHGRRDTDVAPRPHRADREAAVHVLLSHATILAGPFIALRLVLGSAMRSIAYLLGKDVAAARDEIVAVLDVALHPSRLKGSRHRGQATATEPASVAAHLRPRLAWQLRQGIEAAAGIATTSGTSLPNASVSALESGPSDDDAAYLAPQSTGRLRRLLMRPATVMAAALAMYAFAVTWQVWWGDGTLQGGALLPSPGGAGDLWSQYSQAWHDVGPGSSVAAAPYLMVIYPLAVLLLGKAWLAVNVLLLLAIPIAGWAVYFTLRGVVQSTAIRVWAGVAYALLPAMTGAVSAGRIGTTMAAILLPFVVRSCVRLVRRQGTFRRAAGTALLLTGLVACVPALWVIALILATVVTIAALRSSGRESIWMIRRMWFALLVPLVLLWPWTGRLFAHPVLLLFEPGVSGGSLADPDVTSLDVLLLHPGGPGMTPVLLSIGLVLAGFLAFMRRDRLTVVSAAWLVGLLGLLLAVLQTVVLVVPPGSSTVVRPWPGPATLVFGLALIGAAAYAADGLRARLSRVAFNLMQPVGAVVAVLAVAAPLLTAVLWAPGATDGLTKAPISAVPAFVAADAVSSQAPRTIVLREDDKGRVVYSMINAIGPELGDADVAPPADVWTPIDPLIADLASGRGGDEVAGLAAYGIRYILLASGTSASLIPILDGEPGLRRLSSASGEVLWRISGMTSRARIVSGAEETSIGVANGADLTAAPYLDQRLPDGTGARALVIGADADAGWRGVSVDQVTGELTSLSSVAASGMSSWSQSFQAPEGSDQVIVQFDQGSRTRWLWLQLIVLLVLVVLALPSRTIVELDPDVDAVDAGEIAS